MLTAHDSFDDADSVPPECRATVARIQNALDGAPSVLGGVLDADPHSAACPACRERVRAARLLLAVLATPAEPVAVPAEFADRVVAAVAADAADAADTTARRSHVRSRTYRTVAWLAIAAAVLIGAWFIVNGGSKPNEVVQHPVPPAPQGTPEPPDQTPGQTPDPAPDPRPIRIGDEFAKAGQAVLEAPKPITESVAVAPKVLDVLTGSFKLPAAPADPMGPALEPARKSLAELPIAARTGLEPVTGTAEKAFNRFLRDVGAVKPNS
jgi:hypothetical protein